MADEQGDREKKNESSENHPEGPMLVRVHQRNHSVLYFVPFCRSGSCLCSKTVTPFELKQLFQVNLETDRVRPFLRHDFAFWEYWGGGGVKDPFMDPGCICENRLSSQLTTVTGV